MHTPTATYYVRFSELDDRVGDEFVVQTNLAEFFLFLMTLDTIEDVNPIGCEPDSSWWRIRLKCPADYEPTVLAIRDAVTCENMLRDVEVGA